MKIEQIEKGEEKERRGDKRSKEEMRRGREEKISE